MESHNFSTQVKFTVNVLVYVVLQCQERSWHAQWWTGHEQSTICL